MVLTRARTAVVMLATAAATTATALVESAADQRTVELGPVGVAVAVGLGAAVLVAARRPVLGALVGVALFPVPTLLLGSPGPGGAQLVVVMGLVGWAGFRTSVRWSGPVYAAAVLVPAATLVAAGETAWELLFLTVIIGLAWSMGVLLRRERSRSLELRTLTEQLRMERAHRERQVVADERARISRELHDAVAHSMSVMTLQVGVVRRRLGDRPVERDALAGVEELGRGSVDELRRIVGLVRDGGDPLAPAPSLGRLDELVAQVSATGADVALTVVGEPVALPPTLDSSAYRVVQEALSNALRHAPGARVAVAVEWSRTQVRLRVRDDGTGSPGPAPTGVVGGHGLVGMQERVALFGGTLRSGTDGDGWVVEVVLPVPA